MIPAFRSQAAVATTRELRIDTLSAGILFRAFRQKEQAYLRLRTVGAADRYTITPL
jgi:hypothetical protein